MANVFDVAKYIVEKSGPASAMKLHKLCYYAQAWNLAWDDEPLFEEDFQSQSTGPVCMELAYDIQNNFLIKSEDIDIGLLDDDLTEKQKENIDKVLDYYGEKDTLWLTELSKIEDPYRHTRQLKTISKESIKNYYRKEGSFDTKVKHQGEYIRYDANYNEKE